jgi:hypothetical protein
MGKIRDDLITLKGAINIEHELVTLEVEFTNILINLLLDDWLKEWVESLELEFNDKKCIFNSEKFGYYIDKEILDNNPRFNLIAVEIDSDKSYDLVYVEIYEDEMFNDSYLSDRKIDLYKLILDDFNNYYDNIKENIKYE